MKKTLLQKAKEIEPKKTKYNIKDEHIELAFAWLNDEVTNKQINFILGKKSSGGNALYAVAVWLREAYRQGKLKIKN